MTLENHLKPDKEREEVLGKMRNYLLGVVGGFGLAGISLLFDGSNRTLMTLRGGCLVGYYAGCYYEWKHSKKTKK